MARTVPVGFGLVAPPSATQLAWRRRIEAVIKVVAPALDLMLAAGERVSRRVEPEDLDYVPPRRMSSGSDVRRVGPGPAATD
jgi:hypothetical protein